MDYAHCPMPADELDWLLDAAAATGALADGHVPGVASGVGNEALYFAMALQRGKEVIESPTSNKRWSPSEIQFLRDHIHCMSDAEIAAALGRSADGVKIYRNRILKIKSTTKLSDYPSLNQVALLFGTDSHSVIKWADRGLIESRDTGIGARESGGHIQGPIRVVSRKYLKRWALQPENWMLFKAHRISDPSLRRMVLARQERWGDKWLTPGQVAEFWGCDRKYINILIHRGKLNGIRWGNWWVRQSEVLEARRPRRGRGSSTMLDWPVHQDVFVVLARALGLTFGQMEQMGCWKWSQLQGRFAYLEKTGRVPGLVKRGGLTGVQLRKRGNRHVDLFADWRDYVDRFPRMAKAIDRFKSGTAKGHHLDYVQAVLRTWARWYGPYDLAQSLIHSGGGRARVAARTARLMKAWETLRSSGLEPL